MKRTIRQPWVSLVFVAVIGHAAGVELMAIIQSADGSIMSESAALWSTDDPVESQCILSDVQDPYSWLVLKTRATLSGAEIVGFLSAFPPHSATHCHSLEPSLFVARLSTQNVRLQI